MTPTPPLSSSVNRLLLIGWDAADWQMIDPLLEQGKMPVLQGLIDNGVMGNLATLHPVVSPMLWTSIATGKLADKHGIHGFTERDPQSGGPRPFASTSRRTKALWNIFQQALGWRCNVVAWWASHPAEPLDGVTVSNQFFRTRKTAKGWSVPPHSVHPPELMRELAPLRLQIEEVGEELVLPFIPRGGEINQTEDGRLEPFASVMSDCCSVQAVATALMEREPWNFTAVYFDAIDHFAHAFMPYHPPRQEHIAERDFEIYGGVMEGVYRFHDLMLGRLLELAGPDTTVVLCSDHGFQSGATRPITHPREPAGPVLWHREFGMLVMSGPGVKRDERIYGAGLLDLAPTLLTLVGLPVGRDMDGKPLLEALVQPEVPRPIPSWDDVPGRDGCHPPGFKWSSDSQEASEEMMRQFAALGYIDDPGADRDKAGANAENEGRYNLAEVYLSTDRADEAIPLLEDLVAGSLWESRYIHQLVNAYLKAGYYRAAEELLDRAYPPEDRESDPPLVVWQMLVKAKLRRGDRRGAAQYLRYSMDRMLRFPTIWVESGVLWLALGALDAAEFSFRRAVQLDADAAAAFQGLSTLHLRRRENHAAIDAALEATQRLYHLPRAHLNLGIGLAREGRFDDALVAFRRAVGMRPGLIDAHRWLAAVYSTERPNSFLAGVHRNEAHRLSRTRATGGPQQRSRAETPRPIPEIPSRQERERLAAAARPLPTKTRKVEDSGRTFLLVSGLPRSGTSLMMQMLAAGGLPPRTDGDRAADVDNPEGYFEWEAIKRIAKQPELLDEPGLEHRAIKVISALLPSLPRQHRYRVIFMRRPPAEIARSQAKMIAHRGTAAGLGDEESAVAAKLSAHRDDVLEFLRSLPNTFALLEVDYPTLVADPESWTNRITDFIGSDLLPQRDRMAGAMRGELHRNKITVPSTA